MSFVFSGLVVAIGVPAAALLTTSCSSGVVAALRATDVEMFPVLASLDAFTAARPELIGALRAVTNTPPGT